MRKIRLCVVTSLSALFLCNTSVPLFSQPPKKQSLGATVFHDMLSQAYKDVKKNYYDPKYSGVDLDATYRQFDTALDVVKTNSEAFRVIAGFLFNLHDSHTFFVPPSRVYRSDRGFHIEMVGENCFVTRVRPGSDAAAKLHVGDQVLGVNGFKVERAGFDAMQYLFNVLSPDTKQQLILQSPSGELRTETVQSAIRPGKDTTDISEGENSIDFWKLIRDDQTEKRLDRGRTFDVGDTFIWKMPQFDVSTETITATFSKAKKHRALILDLRGNPGGTVDTLKDMLGNVFDHDVKVYDRTSRKETKPELAKTFKNAFRGVFTGKLIVLVDSRSASAAEIFARVIQIEHRGTVLGDRTDGAVMEARQYGESDGVDTRVFYGFSITSANLVMTDGERLEGTGVMPDEMILPTASELSEGKDRVLSRATELAGTKLDPAAAGKLFPFEWHPI